MVNMMCLLREWYGIKHEVQYWRVGLISEGKSHVYYLKGKPELYSLKGQHEIYYLKGGSEVWSFLLNKTFLPYWDQRPWYMWPFSSLEILNFASLSFLITSKFICWRYYIVIFNNPSRNAYFTLWRNQNWKQSTFKEKMTYILYTLDQTTL